MTSSSPPPIKRPARTWPWVLLTFIFLALCSLAALVFAVTGGKLPTLAEGPSWTPPAPAAEVIERGPEQGDTPFTVGDRVTVPYFGGVRLRRSPGFQNKPENDIIRTILDAPQGIVLDGPVTMDGLRWWLVRFDNDEGWMADQSSQGRLLLTPVQP